MNNALLSHSLPHQLVSLMFFMRNFSVITISCERGSIFEKYVLTQFHLLFWTKHPDFPPLLTIPTYPQSTGLGCS